jgi:glycerophosphoryl diester phosphodiesterase
VLDLRDPQNIVENRPILIAHRGGVVSPDTPENSLGAIRLASQRGYDMVELDIMEAKDHVPVLFHAFKGRGHLFVDCGIDQYLEDFTSDELSRITYRLSSQTIARLSDALELCADLELGVMLDIKVKSPSDDFLQHISEYLKAFGLQRSGMTLSLSPRVERELEGLLMFRLRDAELNRLLDGEEVNLHGRYYFDWGSRIEAEQIRLVQESGAFVIAAINFFQYPRHARRALAAQDIQRLQNAGVDGFQIDDEFKELVVNQL